MPTIADTSRMAVIGVILNASSIAASSIFPTKPNGSGRGELCLTLAGLVGERLLLLRLLLLLLLLLLCSCLAEPTNASHFA